MYRLNGVALNDPANFRYEERTTKPSASFSPRSVDLTAPGRRGNVGVPALMGAPVLSFVVSIRRVDQESFNTLLASPSLVLTRDDQSGWALPVEFLGVTAEEFGPSSALVRMSFLLRANGVYWRDIATTDSTFTAAAGVTNANVLSGTSAPVSDALVRVAGGFTSVKVQCGSSFFLYTGAVSTAQALRVDCDAVKAYLMSSPTAWTGGTDVTANLSEGPGDYLLDLVPAYGVPPSVPIAVTLAGVTGTPQVTVRGRLAHAV